MCLLQQCAALSFLIDMIVPIPEQRKGGKGQIELLRLQECCLYSMRLARCVSCTWLARGAHKAWLRPHKKAQLDMLCQCDVVVACTHWRREVGQWRCTATVRTRGMRWAAVQLACTGWQHCVDRVDCGNTHVYTDDKYIACCLSSGRPK